MTALLLCLFVSAANPQATTPWEKAGVRFCVWRVGNEPTTTYDAHMVVWCAIELEAGLAQQGGTRARETLKVVAETHIKTMRSAVYGATAENQKEPYFKKLLSVGEEYLALALGGESK